MLVEIAVITVASIATIVFGTWLIASSNASSNKKEKKRQKEIKEQLDRIENKLGGAR